MAAYCSASAVSTSCEPHYRHVEADCAKHFCELMFFTMLPRLRMSVCTIPKVALTMITDFGCGVNQHENATLNNATVANPKGYGLRDDTFYHNACRHFSHTAHKSLGMSPRCLAETLMQPQQPWLKVAFVRDLLERFLSGFLSKCAEHDKGGSGICQYCFSNAHITFAEAAALVALAPKGMRTSLGPWSHFRLQHEFCGGLRGDGSSKAGWTLHALTSRSVLPRVLEAAMHERGATPKDEVPGWKHLFPSYVSDLSDGAVGKHHTRADTQVLRYYTPSVARDVLHFVAPDYRLLNLPVPEWAVALLGGQAEVNAVLYSSRTNGSVQAADHYMKRGAAFCVV